jgi:hypothetical protein
MTPALYAVSMLGFVLAATMPAPDPEPYAIFDQARTRWETQHYPQYVSYDVVESVIEGGHLPPHHYHATADLLAEQIDVNPVSDEERAHPYFPKGLNVVATFQGRRGFLLSKPDPPVDPLGVPVLAPDYSFGLRRGGKKVPASDTTAQTRGLKTIADVHASSREYEVMLIGIERFGDHNDYHLALHPISQPDVHRLREMWVDTQNLEIDQMRVFGNFSSGPWSRVTWTVQYTRPQPQYIAREFTDATLRYRGLVYLRSEIVFTDVSPIAHLPMHSHMFVTNRANDTLREP